MSTKERLHELVDDMTEREATQLLARLEQDPDDPLAGLLDDEELFEEETGGLEDDAVIAEAWEEYRESDAFGVDESQLL